MMNNERFCQFYVKRKLCLRKQNFLPEESKIHDKSCVKPYVISYFQNSDAK